jgi:glycosyltransferase involved in cell wall biosynthesis
MRLVKDQEDYDVSILCVRKGELLKEFKTLGDTGFLKEQDHYHEKSPLRKLSNAIGFFARLINNIRLWTQADVVFSNTIGNGKVMQFYSRFKKIPICSYIHELEHSIRVAQQTGEAQITLNISDKVISPSRYNMEVLRSVFNVPREKIYLLRYLIINNMTSTMAQVYKLKQLAKEEWCAKHRINPEARLVLGMGTFDKRKGIDLFIRTAKECQGSDIHFCWIGMAKEPELKKEMDEFVSLNNINNFHYLGSMPHDMANYLPFDILFLSSREDPYPLVVLEAAAMHLPTICFKDSGGIIDFITEDCGWLIEGFDTMIAARTIVGIAPETILEKGAAAATKANAWHFDKAGIYHTFQDLIRN